MSSSKDGSTVEQLPWWSYLSLYHWYVFGLAVLGWLFDTMDVQIFTASKALVMKDLLPEATDLVRTTYTSYVVAIFILGWATGGLVFSFAGDRWGRAKTMALTILIYATFTGLSGLARTWWQFGACRFLTGLGMGGEFAAGAALVAEVMPEQARAKALGLLQALTTVGNVVGVGLFAVVEPRWGWQWLYFTGAFPALLAVVVRLGLKEPDPWIAAKALAARAATQGIEVRFGSLSELFAPRWRRNTLVGLSLAIAGVIGVWGVGFWTPELIDSTLPTVPEEMRDELAAALASGSPDVLQSMMTRWSEQERKKYLELLARSWEPTEAFAGDVEMKAPLTQVRRARLSALLARALTRKEKTALTSKGLIAQQIGAFFGMLFFSAVAVRTGRRLAFLVTFLIGWLSVVVTFYTFHDKDQIWYLWPLLGFGTLAPFGGYALYFPELFPTRLRTTGIGFCYNVGRYFAVIGPLTLGRLGIWLHGRFETPGFRLAAILVASSYLIGIVALIWAPETAQLPLPEEERR